MTFSTGVIQSDLLIRAAITRALDEMRANPKVVENVFQSLAQDTLTSGEYGEAQIEQAKDWFLKTEIPIFMSTRIDEAKFPCISIALVESVETEATLGDVHYEVQEDTDADWPPIAGPFAPAAYAVSSGMMRLPASVISSIVLVPGMVIVDRVGKVHSVLEILDDDLISLTPGTVADFGAALLKGPKPKLVTPLESLNFRETYSIGLHAQGEVSHLYYLYSIVAYALLRYKETLLEGRGFERSTMAWAGVSRNEQTEVELVFSRYCTMTGYVRQIWMKPSSDALALSGGQILIGENNSDTIVTPDGLPITGNEPWLAIVDTDGK